MDKNRYTIMIGARDTIGLPSVSAITSSLRMGSNTKSRSLTNTANLTAFLQPV